MADGDGLENAQGAPTPAANPLITAPAPATSSAPGPEGEEFDKDRAMATIKKLREFEKTAKASLKELELLKAEREQAVNANLTEAERLKKELAEKEAEASQVRAELTTTRRLSQVAKVAGALGAIDPQDANILAATADIDPASDKAEEEVKAALEALKVSKSYLFGKGAVRLEGFNPGGAKGGPETDAQRLARIRRASGQAVGPFG